VSESRWRNVSPADPERTARSTAEVSTRSLEDALRRAICDPGGFTPRRMRGRKGDREYETVESWGARACAVLVRARLGVEGR
jgi:hypothetical protein